MSYTKFIIATLVTTALISCSPESNTDGDNTANTGDEQTSVPPSPSPEPSPSPSPEPSPSPSPTPAPAKVQNGPWAGNQANLFVRADGANIEWGCAHGTLDEPLFLDENDRFIVMGTYTSEEGPDSERPRTPVGAQYSGQVVNGELTLAVTLDDGSIIAQVYMLDYGQTLTLDKCL